MVKKVLSSADSLVRKMPPVIQSGKPQSVQQVTARVQRAQPNMISIQKPNATVGEYKPGKRERSQSM